MAPTNRKPGGWVVPGFRYLGPFNPLNNGEPVNFVDAAAKAHDQAYQDIIDSGQNPYFSFNKADADFLETLSHDSSVGSWLGRSAFHLKKVLAPHLPQDGGDKPGPSGAKKPRLDPKADRAQKRKLYFARSNRPAKQQKMSNAAEPTDDVAGPSDPAAEGRAGGANGGGGGMGGGGGHGVGVSTGGWQAGTVFTDNAIVTTGTRQWYAPIYNGHLYKKLAPDTGVSSNWTGISTPWGYFNFNEYDAHFSPQDWQRLLNEYKRWRPKSMKVKIYNLQIKQVVTLGTDTLYNNDLTAGVHIFCDGSHQFPYSQHPWDTGVMPELPNKVWKLSQYAYFQALGDLTDTRPGTGPDVGNIEKHLMKAAPFYILESASHQVLRTGEETSFTFNFECGWVNNDRVYCPPQADFNPLVPTRRYFATRAASSTPANNKFTYHRYSPYNKPSIWMPGPSLGYIGSTHSSHGPEKARGPVTVVYQPPYTTAEGASANREQDKDQQTLLPTLTETSMQNAGYDVAPVNNASNDIGYITMAYDSREESEDSTTITVKDVDADFARYAAVFVQDGTKKEINADGALSTRDRTNFSELKNVWMYPNQAWDSTPISRDTPIWVKSPRTDRHTMFDTSDGTLPMAHPPGTIFVKVAKIPIPGDQDSYLNLYVTGQVTCQVVWEAERFQTKNWRPEVRTDVSVFTDPTLYSVDAAGVYNTPESFKEGMPTKRGINRVL
ncbi:VP1 [California sea lion bocavirus 1]|uniref:Minor capsid protein VP1 n=2 Tax=California sea lion bocavirus 1 TaxID=1073959 RepID=G1JYW8_9VIRU|nr:VP1 [California sea lion bocavirus 1]AEM37595.1 VP1 [California sea lion bocavirus 1]